MDRGTPSGMGNAFTQAGTARPVPADFGSADPHGNAFTPANDRQPAPGSPYAVAMGNPVMMTPRQMVGPSHPAGPGNVPLLATLKNSIFPSQREEAAYLLADMDWKTCPQIVDGLVTAAREDPAPLVRAGCVRSLAKMRVNSYPVVSAVQSLKNDADPRVRHEVDEALIVLTGKQATATDSDVRPASGSAPGEQK